MNDMLKRW